MKTDPHNALEIIRWILIVYGLLNICEVFMGWYSSTNMLFYFGRATGQYWYIFYIQIIPNTILPLLLFFKKLGRNKYVLLTVSFLINLSWLFELISIYAVNTHKEYTVAQNANNYLWFLLLKGLLIGGIIYAVGNTIAAFQRRRLNAR
ncbi:MAG: hypothetical protein JKY70_17740 [Mucilaginibacter sp.]|nr:hypothetical protein [Mucilaginibacter sp.]